MLRKEVETRGGMLGAEHQKYTSAYPTFWPHCQAKLAKGESLDSGSSGKRRFLGSCFLVLVSWFLLLVSWFLVLVSWFLVLDCQCEHACEVCSQAYRTRQSTPPEALHEPPTLATDGNIRGSKTHSTSPVLQTFEFVYNYWWAEPPQLAGESYSTCDTGHVRRIVTAIYACVC